MQVDTQGYEYASALAAWGKMLGMLDDVEAEWGKRFKTRKCPWVYDWPFSNHILA